MFENELRVQVQIHQCDWFVIMS